jgi:hypothetical protein
MFFVPPAAHPEARHDEATDTTPDVPTATYVAYEPAQDEITHATAQPPAEMNLAVRLLLSLVVIFVAAVLAALVGRWVLLPIGLGLTFLHGFMKGMSQPAAADDAETSD